MGFAQVGYRDGAVELTGLHARPAGKPRAAVAIYPTFMNTTAVVEAKAAELVEAGYAVLIGDFYGPETPADGDEAFAAMSRLRSDPASMRQRLRATLAAIKQKLADMPANSRILGFNYDTGERYLSVPDFLPE